MKYVFTCNLKSIFSIILLILSSLQLKAQTQMNLPVTFEGTVYAYGLVGFGGAEVSTIEVDPTNASNTVAKVIKSNTAQVWAGTTVTAPSGNGFSSPVPFTSSATTMTLKVWSPDAGIPVLLKVESSTNGAISVETQTLTTVANAWETLTFNFANHSPGTPALNLSSSYNKASVFFNFGTSGAAAGTKTYYFDDMAFVAGSGPLTQMNLPVTFQGTTIDYGLISFGGTTSTIEADPINASNTVAKVIKSNTAATWAGTTVSAPAGLGFTSAVPFATGATNMTVYVYSPDAGIPVRLKVENHANPAISVETEAITTVANAWQTLTFNFANQSPGTAALNLANSYTKASIFFNFGTDGATAGTKTYYFDDVAFAPPVLAQMNLPVTFEGTTTAYGLIGFGGAELSTIEADPLNASNTVAKVIKSNTAALWAGTTVSNPAGAGFSSAMPFAVGATSMTVKVYSPDAGIPVRLKVEASNNPTISVETEATTTVANAWQTLTFNFANQAPGTAALNMANSYNKASIFFNFGTDGATAGTKTYYFDDMQMAAPLLVQMTLPVTFEGTTTAYGLVGFGGAEASTIEADPVNASNTVAKVIKNNTAQTWAGTTVTTPAQLGFASPVPFAVNATSMSVKVYSPDAGIPVRLKVEDHTNPTISVETEAITTVANAWETLTFNFANQAPGTAALNMANSYNKASIFFNFGTAGATAGTKTYYFDDMMHVPAPVLTQMNLPVTFEGTTVAYGLVGFGGAEASTIEPDPVNALNTVAKVIKSNTAQLWAGTTVTTPAQLGFSSPVPFAVNATSMSVKVYSPDAGIPVRLKVEDHTNPTITVETEATTTVANAWETLTFNFANQAPGTAALNLANNYNKASIFFNFGTDGATAGTKTYYFDDMMHVPAPVLIQMNLPVTFEGTTTAYGLVGFGGAEVSTIEADPLNASNTVAKVIKSNTAALWAGTTVTTPAQLGFATAIPFVNGATSLTVKVLSPDAGIPVRLKVENHTNPTVSVETEAVTTVAGAWETLTFNFANQASGTAALNLANSYNKASIFFNFGTDGATAGTKTYYFDDMMHVPLAQMNLPVMFENISIQHGLIGFGGAEASTIEADPVNASNTVAKVIKNNTAQLWAGTTVTAPAGLGFASPIPFAAGATSMTVKVYSPDAGIPVRLKVEDHTNAAISVETEATTTVANAWETLTFNFANHAPGTAALNLSNSYNKASIFFNFGTDGATAGTKTYYFDDMAFYVPPATATLNLNVFVEGYYISGSSPAAMNPVLYNNFLFGGPMADPTDVTTVTVQLWPNAGGAAHTATGMLASDGSLTVTYPGSTIGNAYWISVLTSNTLRTFSSSSITMAATNSYNFTNALTQAATDGSSAPMATLAAGLFGLRSGDINQDEFIDGSDYSVFEGDVILSGGGAFNLVSDLNGDGFVDGTDYPIFDLNSSLGLYAQYPTFL